MWAGNVAFSELARKSNWKVEFYCSNIPHPVRSVYPLVKLGDILSERRETLDPQLFPKHLFNYVGLENVASSTGDLVGFMPKLGKTIKSRSKIFREGDVLYGRLRPYLNKVLLVDEQLSEGLCSGEFYVFIPDKNRVLPSVARLLASSDYVQKVVASRLTGAALPRLQLDELLEVKMPIPPLNIQYQYEVFIKKHEKIRRDMAIKARDMPELLLQEIIASLESGRKPSAVSFANNMNGKECFCNPLPGYDNDGIGRKKTCRGQRPLIVG